MLTRILKTLKKESPIIFATAASCGLVATVVSSVKAGMKMREVQEELELIEEPTTLDKVYAYGQVLAEPVAIATATAASLSLSVILSKKQYAFLSSAYILLDKEYKNYRQGVIEYFGIDEEAKLRDALTDQKLLTEHPIPDDGEALYYDTLSRRYFTDTPVHVVDTEMQFNKYYQQHNYAEVNTFYEMMDHDELPPLEKFVGYGWNLEYDLQWRPFAWIEFEHKKVTMDDGLECIWIRYPWPPSVDYDILAT